jgi:hypothetical protein
MINPMHSSKFLSPMLTAGLVGTLATTGMENSQSNFWAIAIVADGAEVTGSFVSGVAEEEAVCDRFFLSSASGFAVYLSGREKPVIHYPVFIHNRRKQAKLPGINNVYLTCILS